MVLERLLDNLALSVQPFATCQVADHWRLRLPRCDWVTFHFVLAGEGELALAGGDAVALKPNMLAIIPHGLGHALECHPVDAETDTKGQRDNGSPLSEFVAGPSNRPKLTVACGRVLVSVSGGIGLFDSLREAIVLDYDGSPRMRSIFEELIEEYRRYGPASMPMMTALMNQCLIRVLRRLVRETDGALPWLSALDDPRLARVVDIILRHPERPHTLESLASLANMSRATFARHFGQSFRRTPMDYVREVRLREAAKLLRARAMPIDGIASKVGYSSRSHFSRAFRDEFGVSPRDFRGLGS